MLSQRIFIVLLVTMTLFGLFLVIFLGQSAWGFVLRADECQIDLTSLSPQPILVQSEDLSFLYPQPGQDKIVLKTGDVVELGCPKSNSYDTTIATCISGTQFEVNNKTVSFSSLKCSSNPYHTARLTKGSCENDGLEAEIGWVFSGDIFVRQIRLCFDPTTQNTLYSTYNLTSSIGAHESGVARPSFIEDSFYDVGSNRVNDLYERNGQRKTINGLVGLSASSTKYVATSSDFFLSRGHLTAKADFVYGNQQKATFHYINVAPQWQTFNGGSWNTVEMNVRDFAEAKELDLVVYTGTYGVATLPHEETGEQVPLYLYVDGNNKGLPVPELYWKAVHNPATEQGVVILGVNNPYQEDLNETLKICQDVSKEISWIDWSEDLTLGYIWACDVNDLRQTIDYMPAFKVSSLLV